MKGLCLRLSAALLALPILALPILFTAPSCLAQGQDDQLKAAYILNIALFTTWPPVAVPPKALTVCASPQHSLWDSLRQLDGRNVNGRTWVTADAGAGKTCDIVIVAAAHAPHSAPKETGSALYVIDGTPPGSYAGAIALVDESQHVRFDVDTREAARAGIKFSSRLLRLARNVT
jgi:hypothetical protein